MVLWYDTTIHWYPLLARLTNPHGPTLSPLFTSLPPCPRASIITAPVSRVDNYLVLRVRRECDESVTLFTVLSPVTPATMSPATYPAWAHKCVTDTVIHIRRRTRIQTIFTAIIEWQHFLNISVNFCGRVMIMQCNAPSFKCLMYLYFIYFKKLYEQNFRPLYLNWRDLIHYQRFTPAFLSRSWTSRKSPRWKARRSLEIFSMYSTLPGLTWNI